MDYTNNCITFRYTFSFYSTLNTHIEKIYSTLQAELHVKLIKSLAISLGTLLLLSGAFVTTNAQQTTITLVTLEPFPSVVAVGDEVRFTGTLTAIDGKGLADMTIKIIELRSGTAGTNVLATTKTDNNGSFSTTWIADLDPNNLTRDRIMVVFASFDGAPSYSASKSRTSGLTVAIQDMKVSFTFDKQTYFSGEVATFMLKFSSPLGHPIDPERMRGIYDGKTVSLERASEGVYIYKTPALTPPTHTLQVIAEKHGYKIYNDAKTLSVFSPQTLPGIRLNFDYTPKQVIQGMEVSFTLRFTDLNNVVAPFVNYTFTIKQANQVILDLKDQQTANGTATYMHKFEEGGKYVVTVNINGIGQGASFRKIIQSFDYEVEVIKATATVVKVKAVQKGGAMRITFGNPTLAASSIYTVQLTLEDASKLKIRAPSGWTVSVEGNTITIKTSDSPIEPGKGLQLRAKVQGTVNSFDWSVLDKDGSELKSGTVKVRQLKI